MPVNAGFCGKFFFSLDTTHPAALAHAAAAVRTAVHTWGFSYLKLDFLHAPLAVASSSLSAAGTAASGQSVVRFDSSLTRAEAFANFLANLRAAAGTGAFILG